jgi:hypothetical protein
VADRFYSAIQGEQLPSQITEGSSTSSEAVELRVSDTIYADKKAVVLAVKAIYDYLVLKETSPIA